MTEIIEKVLAEVALRTAKAGAGLASFWNAYQPEEPENID